MDAIRGYINVDYIDQAIISDGYGFEVRWPPLGIAVVLGGVNAVMEAEYGIPIGLRVVGGAAANGSAGPGDVFHHDGLRRKVVLANGLLKDADKGVAATACCERHDYGDGFDREFFRRDCGRQNKKKTRAN